MDFVKSGVDIPEFLADALDEGADVGAVAVGAAARQEVLAVHEVVELAVGDILARLEGELGDHAELGERQVDGRAPPEGAVDVEAQLQGAQAHLRRRLLLGGIGQRPLALRDELDAPHQDREPARLVDEVDRAAGERRLLVDVVAERGQENHRCGDAALAQLAQHLEPVHPGHAPIQQDHLRVLAPGHVLQRRRPVGKGRHREALVHQVEA